MTKSIELRDSVKRLLQGCTSAGIYYQRAEKDAAFPYVVFEIRRLGESDGIERCVLELNAWNQDMTASAIEDIMDQIEEGIHRNLQTEENRTYIIYRGPRQPVDDEDKSIRRIREQFEMQLCESK